MKIFVVLALMAVAAYAAPRHRGFVNPAFKSISPLYDLLPAAQTLRAAQEENYPPTPFEYSYEVKGEDGSHSAQQSGDGSGKVTGSYTITLADGRRRTVTYTADETGFHATIETNELGTESKNPADVTINSSAPTGPEAALQYPPGTPYQHQ